MPHYVDDSINNYTQEKNIVLFVFNKLMESDKIIQNVFSELVYFLGVNYYNTKLPLDLEKLWT